MPSGAKKRKAAKKKKENLNQSHNHSDSASVHPHGDENVKHQEDRESDSSPTSQELRIEAEREVRGSSSMQGSRAGNGEEQVGVEESVVLVEKEIKIEDELGVKDGNTNHNEADRNSSDEDSSRSSSGSSSSSDDERHGIKNEQTVEAGDSVPSTISVAPCVVESTLEENGVQKLSSVEESVCTSVNAASYGEEEANAVRSAESSLRILDPKECATQENDDRSTSSCIDSRAAINNGAQHAKDSVVTEFKKRRGRVAVDCSKCLQDLARKLKKEANMKVTDGFFARGKLRRSMKRSSPSCS